MGDLETDARRGYHSAAGAAGKQGLSNNPNRHLTLLDSMSRFRV